MIKQKLEKIFLNRLSFLSTRAKFILAKHQLDNFENFFRFFVLEGKRMNFYSMKECGDKAAAELTSLVRAAAGTSRMSIARKPKGQGAKYRQKKTVYDFLIAKAQGKSHK